ncbi:MAG: preprotein translocase subunit SecA [Spirochaetales bacterium]|nr:preprotein translocase subunit SecA [Spirochaetales bacterium]
MNQKWLKVLFGSQHDRDLKQLLPILHEINDKERWARDLEKQDFIDMTEQFRTRVASGETLNAIMPEAFAMVREAARRALGERPFDAQILGAIVLHQGKVMEMKTGEGKTLSCVGAAYLNALVGDGVHIVTVNDYLAERDADWMRPIFLYLGMSVGVILSQMDPEARRAEYARDVTYGTNNEFGFDYLRDNMRWDATLRVQASHRYCIIDEIDSILIDEARTPLIISGAAEDDTARFQQVNRLAPQLVECDRDPETDEYPEEPVGDYKVEEKNKKISFTDAGLASIEKLLIGRKLIQGSIFLDDNFEFIHYFTQSLKAHRLFKRDVDYVVQNGGVQIVDEFTGRILHGRRYSEGLHQAIEAKENINIAKRNKTLATVTFQNFFRMYDKIAGMTGTADTEAREFAKIYNLEVVVLPTNRPLIRDDQDDVIYLTEKEKNDAIGAEIVEAYKKGQPVLVGTVSIEKSELLSQMLVKHGVKHEVLNAKNHAREALIIAEAGSRGSVTIATNMAGRGTDIKLGGNPDFRARRKVGTEASDEEFNKAFAREYQSWLDDYKSVKDRGGLYVLGTERHESRRIDNQLRGRSGRQGDPGRSRFFISLDDDLMRLFSDNLKPMMQKLGMKDGEPIFHPWINKSIERAQGRVEERNFDIRKHLLDFDNVLNEQREFIYSQRNEILSDSDLIDRVYDSTKEIVEEFIDAYRSSRSAPMSAAQQLISDLQTNFLYTPGMTVEEINSIAVDEAQGQILRDIQSDLTSKGDQVGKANLNAFIRYEYLRNIDTRWQDHLENLEALREAVYLRSYGQKNPLLEYKLEGFQIFDKLIYDIKTSIAQKIVKVRIQEPKAKYVQSSGLDAAQASHTQLGQFAGSGTQARPAKRTANRPAPRRRPTTEENVGNQPIQVTRTQPKVGRNEPCPCGSGRKYKYCHGS